MQGLPDRIQYAPREGATYEAPIDVLIPALMRLRKCEDSLKTLVLVDSLPDIILPALAWAASSKRYIPPIAVQTLVKYCGQEYLKRCLGKQRARELSERYAKAEILSGL
ncbi:hypothetical protein [Bradyrhizobium archetypum]|uniref:Uncharacterized protein n=1 Tax=Bradyrhizobium archetypum TaxID=2721160 RepID=A0A7Y4H1S5_9BRAD|nr:hypothetical protein [Bradyrhizobium archetypum]NOJ46045.1 hypothetical protein [Bradyrhizobium archetypum]